MSFSLSIWEFYSCWLDHGVEKKACWKKIMTSHFQSGPRKTGTLEQSNSMWLHLYLQYIGICSKLGLRQNDVTCLVTWGYKLCSWVLTFWFLTWVHKLCFLCYDVMVHTLSYTLPCPDLHAWLFLLGTYGMHRKII